MSQNNVDGFSVKQKAREKSEAQSFLHLLKFSSEIRRALYALVLRK